MRLFIAIEVSDEWRAVATSQQEALIAALPPAVRAHLRPVGAELLHVTLRFLGEVDEGAIDPLQAALDAVLPFAVTLSLEPAGTFGPAPRTGVVWLGVASSGPRGELRVLRGLARDVERAVRLVGAPPEDRPYSAHLTLARLARGAGPGDRRAVAEAVRALDAPPPVPFTARELVLVRSYIEGPAPRYEVLSHHP
ncbi:MAG: RNA 2',3'-cyclic phosphodiesterase [Dehalococcoidia bacterium]|nr:RNA 2',3'-cyclic phosphodiesterase [Dehalococcoidia bacterium]